MSNVALILLIVILILLLGGSAPIWPHSQSWGYAPSGVLTVVIIVIVLLVLTGRL